MTDDQIKNLEPLLELLKEHGVKKFCQGELMIEFAPKSPEPMDPNAKIPVSGERVPTDEEFLFMSSPIPPDKKEEKTTEGV